MEQQPAAKGGRGRTAAGKIIMNHFKPTNGFDKRSQEELKAISRNAGIASGKARRHRRQMIDHEKIRQRARQELIREEICGIRIEAARLRAEKRFQHNQ